MWSITLAQDAELTPLEPWQAEHFAEHMDRAREHIRPWVGPSFLAEGLAQSEEVLRRYADGQARDDMRLYGTWADGRLVGGVMLFDFRSTLGVCEAGCWLEPGAEGRGLAAAALREVLHWVFAERGMRRVEWRTVTSNVRSLALAHRLGFRHEGTMRAYYADGRDQEVWALLRPDWAAGQSR